MRIRPLRLLLLGIIIACVYTLGYERGYHLDESKAIQGCEYAAFVVEGELEQCMLYKEHYREKAELWHSRALNLRRECLNFPD